MHHITIQTALLIQRWLIFFFLFLASTTNLVKKIIIIGIKMVYIIKRKPSKNSSTKHKINTALKGW